MAIRPPAGSGYAFRCETCDGEPKWRLDRRGDAVVTWACAEHLSDVCERMQRDHEVTELVVTLHAKLREWSHLGADLEEIAKEGG